MWFPVFRLRYSTRCAFRVNASWFSYCRKRKKNQKKERKSQINSVKPTVSTTRVFVVTIVTVFLTEATGTRLTTAVTGARPVCHETELRRVAIDFGLRLVFDCRYPLLPLCKTNEYETGEWNQTKNRKLRIEIRKNRRRTPLFWVFWKLIPHTSQYTTGIDGDRESCFVRVETKTIALHCTGANALIAYDYSTPVVRLKSTSTLVPSGAKQGWLTYERDVRPAAAPWVCYPTPDTPGSDPVDVPTTIRYWRDARLDSVALVRDPTTGLTAGIWKICAGRVFIKLLF